MTRIIQTNLEPPPTVIDKFRGQWAFLSNFYPCQISYEGLIFPSVEHAYQAAKTLEFDIRNFFTSQLMTPTQAKIRGRTLRMRPNWDFVRVDIMHQLLRDKFYHYPFSNAILATRESKLEEGNDWHDTFWGVCNGQCPRGPHDEEGQNKLGELLVQVREEVKRRKDDNTNTD